jgi:predicted nucleotidyltransferase
MDVQTDKINDIGKKHRLDFVILHGSQATGKPNSGESDIDVAVYREGGIPPEEFMQIYNEMMPFFSGGELDLKTLHAASPLFKFRAAYQGKLLYGDKTDFNDFKAYVYQSYCEAIPLFALEKHLLQKGLKTL